MIVLDASAAIELLLSTDAGEAVARRISDPDEILHAPHLLAAEVAQVLRRYEAAGAITAQDGAAALDDLVALDIERHDHDSLLGRVWELRPNLTAYDALYVALAEVLDAPLLTQDRKLAAAPGHNAGIELVPGRRTRPSHG
ncbi:MAG TPA: type II toxin-antitoxin system VapC family toxin [Acidimicrobiales bacterium]|nr:type II toxin-antitoxin system VapC family toxin [Acidimicrobiales bacterium]